MTLPDPSHPAYPAQRRAESAADAAAMPTHDGTVADDARAQLYLALRARDGRPFTAAYTASVERSAESVVVPPADRAQLSLFGR